MTGRPSDREAEWIHAHVDRMPDDPHPGVLPRPERVDKETDHLCENLVGDAADEGVDEGAVDREELEGANLTALRQPALRHTPLIQGHRITAPGQFGRYPTEHEVLPVDDQDKGRAALDRRQVREGERDRDQGPGTEGQRNPASHVVPNVVHGVVPQVFHGLFGRAEERSELTLESPLNVRFLAEDEGVSRLDEYEIRVPAEPVPLANLLWNHNLALARNLHDVHDIVRQVLLLKPCPGWYELA